MSFFLIFIFNRRSAILIVQLVVVNWTSITEITPRPHRRRRFTASRDAAAVAVRGVNLQSLKGQGLMRPPSS